MPDASDQITPTAKFWPTPEYDALAAAIHRKLRHTGPTCGACELATQGAMEHGVEAAIQERAANADLECPFCQGAGQLEYARSSYHDPEGGGIYTDDCEHCHGAGRLQLIHVLHCYDCPPLIDNADLGAAIWEAL